jgi:hypothetical protein
MSYTISATAPFERARNALTTHRITKRNELKEGLALHYFGPRASC